MRLSVYVLPFLLGGILFSCQKSDQEAKRFTFLSSLSTNIDFSNDIALVDSMNILNYIYFFNGGGVGLGDINNDGLEDVFFTGNQVSNRLYLNKGNLTFEDITEDAGLINDQWCTGVNFVDINTDGFLDIYVCVTGLENHDRQNLLYINLGDDTFKESAKDFGLDDDGFSTHSSFFDYDRDGDLDLYVLNHSNERESLNTPLPRKTVGQASNTDKLYRNNGDNTFSDVSREAGIFIEGYGLGVSTVDIDNDGWIDIYVSNDFLSNDLLYINNQDGTFTNVISESIREQTYNGMGNDVADFNNDGLVDIAVLDMLPPDPVREKTMAGSMTYDKFNIITSMSYEPQFMRNTLHLNRGNMKFDEIGRYAGIHRTDWSWSVLFMDLDNDGYKDLYITNGYLKDITNKDFIDYNNNLSMFKSKEEADRGTLSRIQNLQGIRLSNYAFRNTGEGGAKFSDYTGKWGLQKSSYSNGAAYGDLDLDGDLDLVINNINDEAFVIRNEENRKSNYILLKLHGPEDNPDALGSVVHLYTADQHQVIEKQTSRGYMSSISGLLHFGLGDYSSIDSLLIKWDTNVNSIHKNLTINKLNIINYNKIEEFQNAGLVNENKVILEESKRDFNLHYDPITDPSNDFKVEPLIPHRMTLDVPVLVAGDVNDDGYDDLLVGGNSDQVISLYIQDSKGSFSRNDFLKSGQTLIDADLVDMNQDGLEDVVLLLNDNMGGSELKFFLNESNNNVWKESMIEKPRIVEGASFIRPADFDDDGDFDFFLGGKTGPRLYPHSSPSFLLRNESNHFELMEVKGIDTMGIIKDGAWIDFDNDMDKDLIVLGEWMNITFLRNQNGLFEDVTAEMGFDSSSGWWNTIESGDFDKDGDIDLICGNLGLNSPFQFSKQFPIEIHKVDLNGDGESLPVITHFVNGKEVLLATRQDFVLRNPFLSRMFIDHQSYAETSIRSIADKARIEQVPYMESYLMHSVVLINEGDGKFTMNKLPDELQLAPIYNILPTSQGIVLTGNFEFATSKGESYGSGMANLLNVVKREDDSMQFDIKPIPIYGNVRSIVELEVVVQDKVIVTGIVSEDLKIYEF